MEYYQIDGALAASSLADLPFPKAEPGIPRFFLLRGGNRPFPVTFHPADARELTGENCGVSRLDPTRLEGGEREADQLLRVAEVRAVNIDHPRWREAVSFLKIPCAEKKRVHLLAVGDVGGTLLTALKLLGGDVISTIGVCDLNEKAVRRWEAEMGQISWPWEYGALPEVEAVAPEDLFACDVFLFAATKAIPPVGSAVRDVRMAQYEANRPLVERFARQAREAAFRGLFVVVSDPVDPLCRAAWRASNRDGQGVWDNGGLFPEQVQGFGLGVMNARAAYFARREPRFASFLTEGRSFGPHGQGLVIANSIRNYDDALSRELTEKVLTANLAIRELGYKPYVAPAVSSGAMQLLLTLRGEWHCGSVPLGEVWFGVRNRFTPWGVETERLPLPDALFDRLREAEAILRNVE